MHKSSTQPLCRYCAKPIRKHSTMVYVRLESERRSTDTSHEGYSRYVYVDSPLKSKAECQQLTNGRLLSVKWTRGQELTIDGFEPRPAKDHISEFTEWDCETYTDKHFCGAEHARLFGYALAEQTKFAMKQWHEAMAKRTQGAA